MIFSNATSVAAPTRGDCNRRLTVPCETAAKIDYDTHARANEHLLERRDSFDTRRRRVHSFAKPPAQDHQTETLDDDEQRQWALDGSTKHLQQRQLLWRQLWSSQKATTIASRPASATPGICARP
jgi:hypothetical protein